MSGTAKQTDGAGVATPRPANDNPDPARCVSEARVATTMAARYLGQLCSHFGHRVKAEHSETDGKIKFPLGTCLLRVEDEMLTLRAHSANADELNALEQVLTEHLARFAYRDQPKIKWVRVV